MACSTSTIAVPKTCRNAGCSTTFQLKAASPRTTCCLDGICRLVLGQYSKQWFGLGLEEWHNGDRTADFIEALQTAFAILGDKHLTHEPQQRAKMLLVEYFTDVLKAVSVHM